MIGERGLIPAGTCLAATLVVFQAWGQELAQGKEGAGDAAKTFRIRGGFQGPLTLITKQGKTVSLKVGVHTWSIDAAGSTFTFEVKGETALLEAMTVSTK